MSALGSAVLAVAGFAYLAQVRPSLPRDTILHDPVVIAGPGLVGQPRWSPDGSQIAYVEFRRNIRPRRDGDEIGPSGYNAYLRLADAGGRHSRVLCALPEDPFLFVGRQFAWRREGTSVLFAADWSSAKHNGKPRGALEVVDVDTRTGRQRNIAAIPYDCRQRGAVLLDTVVCTSPDGLQLAIALRRKTRSGCRYDIGLLDYATGSVAPISPFREADGREVWPLYGLSWKSDRIYFVSSSLRPSVPSLGGTLMPREQIWSVNTRSGQLHRETAGLEDRFPAPHPRDESLAFVRKGSLCLRRVDGHVVALVPGGYGPGQGYCEGPVSWSPDGTRLAFTWTGPGALSAPTIWVASVDTNPDRVSCRGAEANS